MRPSQISLWSAARAHAGAVLKRRDAGGNGGTGDIEWSPDAVQRIGDGSGQ